MPPRGYVGGDGESRATDQGAIDLSRVDPHVELPRRDLVAGFGDDRDGDGVAVRHVDDEACLGALHSDDDRWQYTPPRRQFTLFQRILDLDVGVGRDIHRREDGAQCLVPDLVTLLVPSLVRRRHAVPGR